MAVITAQLEAASIICEIDPVKIKEKLSEIVLITRNNLQELRRSISGLKLERLELKDLIQALQDLFQEYRLTGLEINFSIEGLEYYKESKWFHDLEFAETIYRICQEALTNSIKHGKARHVDIIFRFVGGRTQLFIFDNGYGCREVKKGFGLAGMEQRVQNLQGSIVYGSDGEKGFNIWMEIPLEDGLND